MSEIFAESEREGQPVALDIDKAIENLSDDKVEKTSSESQSEKKQVDKEPSQKGESEKSNTSEEKVPFHKHPRWIKQQSDYKKAQDRIAELESKGSANSNVEVKAEELPDWWKKAYGDKHESVESYKNYLNATQAERKQLTEQIKQDILKGFESEKNEEQSGEEYVNTQLDEMADEGLKFNRNELLKFMVDFQDEYGPGSLLDPQGNYDFRKSLELKNKMQPAKVDETLNERKKLAGETMRSKVKTGDSSTIPKVSIRNLRRGNWRDAE